MKIFYAGPLKAGYENGFLRRISYGNAEVLRMIYFALRDHNWNTLTHVIDNENISIGDDCFLVEYDCAHLEGGVTIMEWKVKLEGSPDGSITFEIAGIMREAAFKKNRAGFCILHPLSVAGEKCRITHPDGTASVESFPVAIAPDNPFKNIRSMTWAEGDQEFLLDFEGDIFETEDQRNWCDASYKTFCTPLDRPFPVEMRRGQQVFQRVTFRPVKALPALASELPYVTLSDQNRRLVLPSIGIAASTEVRALEDEHIFLLKALKLSHYRIELHPASRDFAVDFSNAYEIAYSLGLPLEVALHLSDNFSEEIEAFVILCQQNKVRLRKVLLLSANGLVTGQRVIDETGALKVALPRVLFGGGTNYNFTEINKNRFLLQALDYVSFSVDPQEHAFDDLTILENTGTLEHLVHSAKSIYGSNTQVHVSPVTLRKRFNPYATNPADLNLEDVQKADPRQKEKLGALWTFGAIWGLTKGGASAVTFYQTVGNQGVMSRVGDPYPLYDVLKNFSAFQSKAVAPLKSDEPLSIVAMVLDGKTLAMANFASEKKTVRWDQREFEMEAGEIQFFPLHGS